MESDAIQCSVFYGSMAVLIFFSCVTYVFLFYLCEYRPLDNLHEQRGYVSRDFQACFTPLGSGH